MHRFTRRSANRCCDDWGCGRDKQEVRFLGGIGVGDRWASMGRPVGRDGRLNGVDGEAMRIGDSVAVCDGDSERKERGREITGGKMTDWRAHHIDIAQWAMGLDATGPVEIEPLEAVHPVPFKDGYLTAANQYNAATSFKIRCRFANGAELIVRDTADDLGFDNGIMIEGTNGRIFVNRGRMIGAAVEDLENNPLPEDAFTKLCMGKKPGSQMVNFAGYVKDRWQTISDVFTHHRAMTTCHLCNIAIRLGRTLKWDPAAQEIVGDDEACKWQSREQRKGYELQA